MTEKIKKTKKVGRCKCCKAQKVPLVPDAGIKICERCVTPYGVYAGQGRKVRSRS